MLVAFNGVAAGSGTGDQFVENVQITSMDNLRIKLASESHSSQCASSGKERELMIPRDDPNFDHFMSIALTALTANKKVYMWLDNNTCIDHFGAKHPRPMNISISK